MVNVGTTPGSRLVPAGRAGRGGQARRPLIAGAWGGGPVVVRARESRAHGEGAQQVQAMRLRGQEALVNTGEPWPSLDEAVPRVLRMQAKLHLWAARDPGR